ncbi:hypothetical protein PISMIDRAFT_690995, partial [Pisolithus microcarpus 441]
MRGYKQEPAESYNLRGLSLSRSSVVTLITRAANENYAPKCASANKRSTSTVVVSSPNMPSCWQVDTRTVPQVSKRLQSGWRHIGLG